MKQNIVLLGFMGTGKSSAGKMVAGQLGLSFVDMDDVIESRSGKKISAIFAEEGEASFRQMERSLVQELSQCDGQVIATGGGIVLNKHNIDDFNKTGIVICLLADPETIWNRVSKESHRPLLEGGEKKTKTLSILEARKDLYGSIPLQIDTSEHSIDEVTNKIIAIYEAQCQNR